MWFVAPLFSRLSILWLFLLTEHTFRAVNAIESCSGGDVPLCINVTDTKKENFTSANVACKSSGGGLINIQTIEQLSFVTETIRKSHHNGTPLWIGLYYAGDFYQWISGSQAVTYTNVTSHPGRKECFTLTVLDATKPPIWSSTPCNVQNYYICGRTVTQKPSQSSPIPSILSCPKGFQLSEGTCLMFKESPALSCPQAKVECNDRNAVLTGIPSMVRNDYLSVRIANWSHPAWIGLKREGGVARWQDNSSVAYTNWLLGDPWVDNEVSSCTLLHTEASQLGRWEEVSGSRLAGYVCETKPLKAETPSSATTDPLLNHQGCEPQSYSFQGRCYRVLKSSNVSNFSSACPNHTVPHSSVEWAFTRLVLARHASEMGDTRNIWTGVNMSVESPPSTTSATNPVRLKLHFPGGTSSLYTPTAVDFSQTSFTPSTSYCLVYNLTTTVLSWTVCAAEMPSLCVRSLVGNAVHRAPPSTATADPGNACPSGWVLWNATTPKCLSPMNTTRSTWFEARETCRRTGPSGGGGGDLVSVHSPEDYKFLANSSNNTPVWLGLRVQLLSGDRISHLLHWSDNSTVDYLSSQLVNRSSASANYGEGIEQCVDSVWNASSCYKAYPFFCQRDVGQTVPDTTKQECSLTDPSVCFELHTRAASFWSAASQCQRLGRQLATVTTWEHQALVQKLVLQLGEPNNRRAYIGLFSESGTLSWTTGSRALPLTFWKPKSTHSSEECISIDLSASRNPRDLSSWQTGSCHVPLPFICSTLDRNVLTSGQREMSPDRFPDTYRCPTGFVQAGYNCFSVRAGVEDLYTWSEAAEHCGRLGGSLASVLSQHDQDVLMALLGPQSRSVWIGLRYHNNSYNWIRHDPVNFTMLADDVSLLLSSACVSMQLNPLGEWRGSLCGLHMGYACETVPVKSEGSSKGEASNSLLQQGTCRSGYHAYRGQCFTLLPVPQPTPSFEDARRLCLGSRGAAICQSKQANADKWATADCPVVATPHTRSDAAYLRHLLRALGNSPTAWAGVTLGKERFETEDGQPLVTSLLDFSMYVKLDAMAHTQGSSTLCTLVSSNKTDIELATCGSGVARAVVCSYYQDAHPAHPSQIVPCPEGWQSLGGKCYLRFGNTEKKSWDEAEQTCKAAVERLSIKMGASAERFVGHLPSVHTPEELEQYLPSKDWTTEVWIGLKVSYGAMLGASDLPNRSVHLSWSDKSSVDYIPLHPSDLHVDDGKSAAKCVQILNIMTPSFSLTDCNKPNQFKCQLSLASDGHCTSKVYQHKVQLASSHACYHMVSSALSWSEANATCRGLNPPGNLVSFHSQLELNALLDLVMEFGDRKTDVWFGLYESRFAYRWSDGSPTDYIPIEMDESKANRHLVQDCFVLSPSQDADQPLYFTWRAVNCSEHKAAVVCQPDRSIQSDKQPTPVTTAQPPKTTPTQLSCPPGYSAFLDRCFMVLNESLLWADAALRCRSLAGDGQSSVWLGSLARIDSPGVQEFVSSLLDNLPATSSAAWTGLVRNLTDERSTYHWSDGGNVSYLRATFSLGKQPIFEELSASKHSIQLCVTLSRSPYPRLNGLWLPVSCDTQGFPSICQAQPRTAAIRINPTPTSQPKCPQGFILSPTGQAEHHSLSRPVCYRLLAGQHYNWEKACWELSTPDHHVTGLVIASVYEAHFLRAWLSLDPSHGGAGLQTDSLSVWTALQVPSSCPACHANWSWATGGQPGEPVRFVDWWTSPNGNASGCYLFDTDPYSHQLPSRPVDSGLGSLRPSDCAVAHPVVCQAPARLTSEPLVGSQHLYQFTRPTCHAVGDHPPIDAGRMLPQMVSRSGKPCLRWDMVTHEVLSEVRLDSNFQRRSMSASVDVGGHGVRSYAENYCSSVYNASTTNYSFGCYISRSPLTFETCKAIPCSDTPILNNGHLLSSWQTIAILLLLLFGSVILCISIWNGCIPLKTGYYRRMIGSNSKRNSTVFFTAETPAATILDGTSMDRVPYHGYSNGHSSQAISMNIGGPRPPAADTFGGTVNNDHRSSSAHTPLVKPSFLNSMAFYNPAYTPLKSPSPDDLYDIDEEM